MFCYWLVVPALTEQKTSRGEEKGGAAFDFRPGVFRDKPAKTTWTNPLYTVFNSYMWHAILVRYLCFYWKRWPSSTVDASHSCNIIKRSSFSFACIQMFSHSICLFTCECVLKRGTSYLKHVLLPTSYYRSRGVFHDLLVLWFSSFVVLLSFCLHHPGLPSIFFFKPLTLIWRVWVLFWFFCSLSCIGSAEICTMGLILSHLTLRERSNRMMLFFKKTVLGFSPHYPESLIEWLSTDVLNEAWNWTAST